MSLMKFIYKFAIGSFGLALVLQGYNYQNDNNTGEQPKKSVAIASTIRKNTSHSLPSNILPIKEDSLNPIGTRSLWHVQQAENESLALEIPNWPVSLENIPAVNGPKLRAKAWYVVDNSTNKVLLSHNADTPFSIASITKLMAGLIYTDTNSNPDDLIKLIQEDKNFIQITRSRLRVGGTYRAGDLLFQSLLSSDNRATVAIMRQTGLPLDVFKALMNRRAAILGLSTAHFEEPTGLHANNKASARDVAILLEVALMEPDLQPVIMEKEHYYYRFDTPIKIAARSSNRLSYLENWSTIASKTGYTIAAGSCLVMKTRLKNDQLVTISILGSPGEKGRYPDAEKIREYLESIAPDDNTSSNNKTLNDTEGSFE